MGLQTCLVAVKDVLRRFQHIGKKTRTKTAQLSQNGGLKGVKTENYGYLLKLLSYIVYYMFRDFFKRK